MYRIEYHEHNTLNWIKMVQNHISHRTGSKKFIILHACILIRFFCKFLFQSRSRPSTIFYWNHTTKKRLFLWRRDNKVFSQDTNIIQKKTLKWRKMNLIKTYDSKISVPWKYSTKLAPLRLLFLHSISRGQLNFILFVPILSIYSHIPLYLLCSMQPIFFSMVPFLSLFFIYM
jgi:hypothetical protein